MLNGRGTRPKSLSRTLLFSPYDKEIGDIWLKCHRVSKYLSLLFDFHAAYIKIITVEGSLVSMLLSMVIAS